MGMKTTWAEDCTPHVEPEGEVRLRRVEDQLRENSPAYHKALERWSKSTDENDARLYQHYVKTKGFAGACYDEKSGLLDILSWNGKMPEYVEELHTKRSYLFAEARAVLNNTAVFRLGYEIVETADLGGLSAFIKPPTNYSTEEQRDFITTQLHLRLIRIEIADRRLRGSESSQATISRADVLARIYLYNWMDGFQQWIIISGLDELFTLTIGRKPDRTWRIGDVFIVDWGLFWDDICGEIFRCFTKGNYDRYMTLFLDDCHLCFQDDYKNDVVVPAPFSDRKQEAFDCRRAYFSFGLRPGHHRPYCRDLQRGVPGGPRVQRPATPLNVALDQPQDIVRRMSWST